MYLIKEVIMNFGFSESKILRTVLDHSHHSVQKEKKDAENSLFEQ